MNGYVQDSIVLLGDSLTQLAACPNGYAQRLQADYIRRLDVVNRGFGGYNTAWAIPVFKQCLVKNTQKDVIAPKIRLLIIWFGANDAVLPIKPQYVPLPQFAANLTEIIHLITSPDSEYHNPDTRIILMTPPPVNTYQRGAELAARDPPLPCDREFDNTTKYAEAVREVGRKEKIPVVDVYTKLWEACGNVEKNLENFMTDGLHVNETAYGLIYEDLIEVIKKNYPELHYDNLKFVFPSWDTIDPKNPQAEKRDIFKLK